MSTPESSAVGSPLPEAAAATALRRGRVGFGLLTAYGSGALVDSITQAALNTFLFFYLTAVCGLPNGLAGLSLFLALAVDAVADPVVGSLSDNSWSRLGRRHPFMFAAIGPLALGVGALFSIPAGLSQPMLFAYVTGVSVALRISHSCFFLPYMALGAELTDDYAGRTQVVASRFLFSVAGTAIALVLGLRLFLGGPQGLLQRSAYAPLGWTLAALILVGGLVSAVSTLRALPRLHRITPRTDPLLQRLVRDFSEVLHNRSFVVLLGSLLLLFTGLGTFNTLALHANKFFWGLPPGAIQLVSLAAPVGVLIGVPISMVLTRKAEKRMVCIVGLFLLAGSQALLPLLRAMGVFTALGSSLDASLIANAVFTGATISTVSIAFQSAMADAADEHEHLFGTRREGLYYAGLNFSAKSATGLGSLVAGLALEAIHFPTNIAAKGGDHVVIPPQTLKSLGLIYGPGAAVITLAATFVFMLYRLDRARTAEIQAALAARHP